MTHIHAHIPAHIPATLLLGFSPESVLICLRSSITY